MIPRVRIVLWGAHMVIWMLEGGGLHYADFGNYFHCHILYMCFSFCWLLSKTNFKWILRPIETRICKKKGAEGGWSCEMAPQRWPPKLIKLLKNQRNMLINSPGTLSVAPFWKCHHLCINMGIQYMSQGMSCVTSHITCHTSHVTNVTNH